MYIASTEKGRCPLNPAKGAGPSGLPFAFCKKNNKGVQRDFVPYEGV